MATAATPFPDNPYAECCHDDPSLNLYACHGRFPFKAAPGPCARCAEILKLVASGKASNDPAIVILQTECMQCEGCSTYGRKNFFLLREVDAKNLCPRCIERCSLHDPARSQKERELREAAHARFNKQPVFKAPLPPQPNGQQLHDATNFLVPTGFGAATTDVRSSDGLAVARAQLQAAHSARLGGNQYHIVFEPVLLGVTARLSKQLAEVKCPCDPDDFIPDLVSDALATINRSWIKNPCSRKQEILSEEIELRIPPNVALAGGTFSRTVESFFSFYNSDTAKALYFPETSRRARPSKTSHSMKLVIAILIDTFNARLDGQPTSSSRKRSASSESVVSTTAKRICSPALTSQVFSRIRNSGPGADATAALVTPISFVHASLVVNQEDGLVDVQWEEHADKETITSGFITKEPIATGASKLVYKLNYGGRLWAAKRFKNVGSRGVVSSEENKKAVEDEAKNLLDGEWLRLKFLAAAEESQTSVERNFAFTDVKVIREVGRFSTASGHSTSDADHDDFDAVWLVEPLRARQVIKFSGTLVHPLPTTPLAETIYAFVHYVYQLSKNELVYADLQGTPTNIDGKDGFCLFDPMVHTPEGNNSVGDHGQEGIDAWKKQHVCGKICTAIGLESVSQLVTDEN